MSVSKQLLARSALTVGLLSAVTAFATPVKVIGKVSGFGTLSSDDVVDGAVVIPTLRAQEILGFQIAGFLGPDEEMNVGPVSTKVPGNLFFPTQKERYGFLPVTIAKGSFTLLMEPGQNNELVALRFQAPFSKAADLARSQAPYTELVPLVSLKNFSLGADRDWTRESSVNLAIDKNFNKTSSYAWTRAQGNASEFDILLSFQRSPAARWVPTDIIGKPASSGKFSNGATLPDEMKVLMARITNDADSNPVAVRGWFAAGKTTDVFSQKGVPAPIEGGVMSGSTVSWSPIADHGWMAVLRGSKMKAEKKNDRGFDSAMSVLGDFGFVTLIRMLATSPVENWVDASIGSYALASPLLQDEKISLLFIGTDREVPSPVQSLLVEPELFTYAQQLRMIVLQ